MKYARRHIENRDMVTIEDLAREVQAAYSCGVTGAPLTIVVLKQVADISRWLSDLHLIQKFSIRTPHCFKFVQDDTQNVALYARFMAWKARMSKPWKSVQYINDGLFRSTTRLRGGLGEPLRVIPSPFPDKLFFETIESIEESVGARGAHLKSWQSFLAEMNAIRTAQRSTCNECVRLYDVFRSKKAGGQKPLDDLEQERERKAMNSERARAQAEYKRHQETHPKHGTNINTYTSCLDLEQGPQPFWTNFLSNSVTGLTAATAAAKQRTDALPQNDEMIGIFDLQPNLLDDRDVNDDGRCLEPAVLLAANTYAPSKKNVRKDDYVLIDTPPEYMYRYPFFCLARVLDISSTGSEEGSHF